MSAATQIPTVDPDDTLAVLGAMEAWLTDESRWTKKHYWLTGRGIPTINRDRVACTCIVGAAAFVSGSGDPLSCPPHVREVLADALEDDPEAVNDTLRGYNRVMAGLRKAIATKKVEAAS